MAKYVIGRMPPPLSNDVIEALARVETATIGHVRHWGFLRQGIRALNHRKRIVGCAVTLAIPGQDSTLLHHAVGELRPNDVLVIDRLGDTVHACLGGTVATAVSLSGAAGIILDGPATDPTEIAASEVPVWCDGIAPITTRLYNLGGTLNQPVQCGGVSVKAGDVVLADENGVLVMDRGEAIELGRAAIARQIRIAGNVARVMRGEKLGLVSGASTLVLAEADFPDHASDQMVGDAAVAPRD